MLGKKGKGFTLIEILIALAVLAMGIAMLITMFTVGMKGVTTNQVRTQATNLAQDLMDEIMGKEFRDPNETPVWGVESGETQGVRTTYDDVDDYSAWKNKAPQNVMGVSLGDAYANFTLSVSVARVNPADLQTPLPGDTETAHVSCNRIIVSVSHPDITTVSLYSLKTKSVY